MFRLLCVLFPLFDVFVTWVRRPQQWTESRSGSESGVTRDDTRYRRVVIVLAFIIRYALPRTSYSVVCCIIHIHNQAGFQHRQFCKSTNMLRDSIFQVASMSVISKSNQ